MAAKLGAMRILENYLTPEEEAALAAENLRGAMDRKERREVCGEGRRRRGGGGGS